MNAQSSSATQGNPLSGIKVLVVDDDINTGEILTIAFADLGVETTTVGSVKEALAAFTTLRPNVVISDIGMPTQNGYDLIRQIRDLNLDEGAQVLAIALTAFADRETQQKVVAAGYQRHLAKPISPYDVIDVVTELLKAQ